MVGFQKYIKTIPKSMYFRHLVIEKNIYFFILTNKIELFLPIKFDKYKINSEFLGVFTPTPLAIMLDK